MIIDPIGLWDRGQLLGGPQSLVSHEPVNGVLAEASIEQLAFRQRQKGMNDRKLVTSRHSGARRPPEFGVQRPAERQPLRWMRM
jgi:hypothetical protein